MESLLDEIIKSFVEEYETKIEPKILEEKTINIGNNIFQILKIDSESMLNITSKSSNNHVKLTKEVLKHCTKGLDYEEFMLNNSAGIITLLLNKISAFNDL